MERIRCLRSEHEASLLFASSLLANPTGLLADEMEGETNSSQKNGASASVAGSNNPMANDSHNHLPGGVKDAWRTLVSQCHAHENGDDNDGVGAGIGIGIGIGTGGVVNDASAMIAASALSVSNTSNHNNINSRTAHMYPMSYYEGQISSSKLNTTTATSTTNPNGSGHNNDLRLPGGQLSRALTTCALSSSLQRASQAAYTLKRKAESQPDDDDDNNDNDNNQNFEEVKQVEKDHEILIHAMEIMASAGAGDNDNNNNNNISNTYQSKSTAEWFLKAFYDKVEESKSYHALHDVQSHHQQPNLNSNSITNMTLDNITPQMMTMQEGNSNDTTNQNELHTPTPTPTTLLLTPNHKKRRVGNPYADGYDLQSALHSDLIPIVSGQSYNTEEIMGKYLDLNDVFSFLIHTPSLLAMFSGTTSNPKTNNPAATANTARTTHHNNDTNHTTITSQLPKLTYPDFLSILCKGLSSPNNTTTTNSTMTTTTTTTSSITPLLKEYTKLTHRKKYLQFLHKLKSYLLSFLSRVTPLMDVPKDVIQPATHEFIRLWSQHGGIPESTWECRPGEGPMAQSLMIHITTNNNNNNNNNNNTSTITTKTNTSTDTSTANDTTTTTATTTNNNNGKGTTHGISLSQYTTVQELIKDVTPDRLKTELARLGLKCGGTPQDRANRLWLTKDTPLDQLPKKVFAKGGGGSGIKSHHPKIHSSHKQKNKDGGDLGQDANTNNTINHNHNHNQSKGGDASSSTMIGGGVGVGYQRRVDIAHLEYIVTALLDQVRPVLDATTRRAERRLTQTSNEREREAEEELYGTNLTNNKSTNRYNNTMGKTKNKKNNNKNKNKPKKDGEDTKDDDNNNESDDQDSDHHPSSDDDESDEDDAPIYNPKGVPLGWDGKPIPYWLFKLHGLNHFYPCEICGNESYRGRRNFEKHFTEAKHAYGMRCLGIPNTKHFHGVTKIADAQNLWTKLSGSMAGFAFDGSKEEEYEDSQGNVLSRATYEDLARQGLL